MKRRSGGTSGKERKGRWWVVGRRGEIVGDSREVADWKKGGWIIWL